MQRDVEQKLITWQQLPEHLPLLIRGARQVGKTYLIENFGKQHFKNLVTVNFEYQPEYRRCFETLDPQEIVNAISLLSGQTITPTETLLFLDEIQECPNAILALRYFKERMPALHIIGAGSLLEFIIYDDTIRMPVGRIQFIYLKPLSFREFLKGSNLELLSNSLDEIDIHNKMPDVIHEQLLKLVHQYTILGGMPAVLNCYFQTKDLTQCQNIQTGLLTTYRHDFGKYANKAKHKYLQQVFDSIPRLIGQNIKFSKIDNDMRSRDLKAALLQLKQAGLVQLITATSGKKLPFNALANDKKFKWIFLDTGLAVRSGQLDIDLLLNTETDLATQGAIAEQLVGQELLAYADAYQDNELFFWQREQRNSSAEIDYVMQHKGHIIPIEVKAGRTGRLKSLRVFMQENASPLGIRISQRPLEFSNRVLTIPFYLISQIPRLVTEYLK